jgi:hypothetical protein
MCGANRQISRLCVSGRGAICYRYPGRSASTRRLITTELASLGGSSDPVCALARATHARQRVIAARAEPGSPFIACTPPRIRYRACSRSTARRLAPGRVSGLSEQFNRVCDLLDCLVHTRGTLVRASSVISSAHSATTRPPYGPTEKTPGSTLGRRRSRTTKVPRATVIEVRRKSTCRSSPAPISRSAVLVSRGCRASGLAVCGSVQTALTVHALIEA